MDTHRCIHRNAASRLSSDDRFDRRSWSIDWEATPSLRIKMHMVTGPSGGPKVHSIGISGAINETFSENPAVHDWTLSGTSWSQSSGQVTGTGSLTSPMYRISNGFGAISTSMLTTGSPILEANIDDGGWQTYPLEGYTNLDQVGQTFNSVSNPQVHPILSMPSQSKRFARSQQQVFDLISGPMGFRIGAMMAPMQEVMECRTVLQMETFAKH